MKSAPYSDSKPLLIRLCPQHSFIASLSLLSSLNIPFSYPCLLSWSGAMMDTLNALLLNSLFLSFQPHLANPSEPSLPCSASCMTQLWQQAYNQFLNIHDDTVPWHQLNASSPCLLVKQGIGDGKTQLLLTDGSSIIEEFRSFRNIISVNLLSIGTFRLKIPF